MLNFITVDSWASFLSSYPTYFIAGILMPFVYGVWRFTVYHFLVGPQLAMLLTSNPNEVAAVLVPAINRNSASGREDADKALHVRETLVVVAKKTRSNPKRWLINFLCGAG